VKKPRIAVVGVGHLGSHHARLLSQSEDAELVAVVDSRAEVVEKAARTYGIEGYTDYRELGGKVDAVSVVVPTEFHREVAGYFLERDIDVLVEKPITPTEREGRELVEIAHERGLILQVGHIERFNAALEAIRELDIRPRYIEAHRLAPFTFRSMDIGVVLDLMIHDLDLVLTMVGSELASVDAFGGKVFTPAEDMASAILKFADGTVAHLTANRVATKPMRRMRFFSPDSYVSLDFNAGKGVLIRKGPGWDLEKLDLSKVDVSKIDDLWKFVFQGLLSVEEYNLESANPLEKELRSFLRSVRDRTEPIVTGEMGCDAVAVAHRVLAAIEANPW
jgi:predicted dehydrogenase